uniref:Fatty acyl-CoA reductase n=1 Tax=Cacopsylla melanoneura TaxID=428564 RepID=A0A8D9DWS6_9HEMI
MSGLVKMDPIVTPEFPVDPLQLLGEKSFGKPRHVPVEEVGTPIQEFFRDASVLVTGGTGFMGKTVTEKLLRSCPHLKRIYLIVRTKKGKRGQDRLDDILSDRVFLRLKTEVPNFRNKITIIPGDLMATDLGISSSDRATVVDNVNIVFHGAATVRFDEKFRIAAQINILGVRAMLEMAKEMKHLKNSGKVAKLVHAEQSHGRRFDPDRSRRPSPVCIPPISYCVNV